MPRPKGAPNKTTVAVKDALMDAFSGVGGQQRFNRWADENPTEFYKLYCKLLPIQIAGDKDNPLSVVHKIERQIVDVANPNR